MPACLCTATCRWQSACCVPAQSNSSSGCATPVQPLFNPCNPSISLLACPHVSTCLIAVCIYCVVRRPAHAAVDALRLFQVLSDLAVDQFPTLHSMLVQTLTSSHRMCVQASGFCLVLLSSQAESFFQLAEAAKQIQRQLKQPGVSQVCNSF